MVAASENCRYTSVPNRPVSVRKVWFLDKEDDQYRPNEVNVEAIFEHCHHDPSPDHEWVVLDESNGWRHVFPCTQKTYDRSFNEDLFYGFYKSITIEHFWDYPDYPVQSACIIVNVPIWKYGSREPENTEQDGYTLSVTKRVGYILKDSAVFPGFRFLDYTGVKYGDRKFLFTIEFYNQDRSPLNGSSAKYPYTVTDADGIEIGQGALSETGTCKVSLGRGDTVTVAGLPKGTKYTVTEALEDDFLPCFLVGGELSSDGFVSDTSGEMGFSAPDYTSSGTLSSDTYYTFINMPCFEPPAGVDAILNVTKQVKTVEEVSYGKGSLTDDEAYDENRKFEFTIAFQDEYGEPASSGCPYIVTNAAGAQIGQGHIPETGICKVSLGRGDTVTVHHMAPGTRYTVTESPCAGYEPSVRVLFPDKTGMESSFTAGSNTAEGTIRPVITFDDAYTETNVTFINTPTSGGYELPKTGGEGSMPYAIGGIAAMSLGLGGPLLIGRKRKHGDDRGGAGK